jgi:hypothetical protein
VIDSSNTRITSVMLQGGMIELTIQGFAGHSYQLQRAASLNAPAWQNIGAPQDGSGAVLTFNDPVVVGQFFYRIVIAP